jgi:hypothetical protein
MATAHPTPRGAAAPLEVALSVIPSLPRPLLARIVQRSIERLDELDGDPEAEVTDAEDDWQSKRWLRWRSHGPGDPLSDPDEDGNDAETEDFYQ